MIESPTKKRYWSVPHKFRILGLIVVLLAAFTACGSIEIIGETAREGAQLSGYTIWVDCTVRNNVASREVTIVGELRNGGFWKKRETVFLEKDSEQKVTIPFPEASLLDAGLGGYAYKCATE